MVLPFLSCGLPSTFRSNNTIIHIIQQASSVLTDCFGNLIFNENKAWLSISQQNKSFRHVWKPSYILALPTFTNWYANIIQISYSLTIKLHLLIMSTFIQIPNRINQLPKRSKLEEIFTYAAIRSQIKNESYKAIILKDELAELIGVNVRTIYNHVDILEKSGLILDITKQHGTGEYSHNVYQFDYLKDEYFIMNPDLIHEESISAKLKGLLMLIKANCIKGTNYLQFNSK